MVNIQYIVNSSKIWLCCKKLIYFGATYVETYVSTCHLQVLVTHWRHVCLLRFRRDDLVVCGGQVVSLVFVHGRGSPFDTYSLLNFSLVQVGFTRQYTRDTST